MTILKQYVIQCKKHIMALLHSLSKSHILYFKQNRHDQRKVRLTNCEHTNLYNLYAEVQFMKNSLFSFSCKFYLSILQSLSAICYSL